MIRGKSVENILTVVFGFVIKNFLFNLNKKSFSLTCKSYFKKVTEKNDKKKNICRLL